MRTQIKTCSSRLFDRQYFAEGQDFILEMARADRLHAQATAIRMEQWAIYRQCLGIKPKAKKGVDDDCL
jgi:hypothetical protein